ncbi:MAG TPA: response regulator [Steroidobacteraceae bacterium]|nr:response regulator [Steroidobacteraceae bacterium]
MEREGPMVYVVDDDELVRSLVQELATSMGAPCRQFSSAEEYLQNYDSRATGCLVLDIGMPGMSGLELQEELNRRGSMLPIVFMTGQGDVPVAVQAMKRGAFEFLQKPVTNRELLAAIRRALDYNHQQHAQSLRDEVLQQRLATLTERERQILNLMAVGATNKKIARDLAVSERTVEVHRARIIEKMAAESLAHLIRMVIQIERTQPPQR